MGSSPKRKTVRPLEDGDRTVGNQRLEGEASTALNKARGSLVAVGTKAGDVAERTAGRTDSCIRVAHPSVVEEVLRFHTEL